MRQDHVKHDWSWWKSEIIKKLANNYWKFKIENAFEIAIFNSSQEKPLNWFLKPKYRLCALHPDMSDSKINMNILRKFRGELEHSIKCRFVESCSTEYYINATEDIITSTEIGKTWIRNPMESKVIPNIFREDKKPVLKCHKCRSTSHLANTCIKKTKIKKVQVIE
ncbi:hypothetical protein O181_130804 [Austropuccinia psidii MF-1]|uniref:Uncharacterized protein n=1 Tax=Austropuccinia psidii MF-1 TaxID=1389203 RepID=A0A9Q3L1P5_9BASI|nr:hypothetical protein [Austropuccinia psidii MF-1]